MARYGRRGGMHWMWQPRSMNGRFANAGGGGKPQEDPEWWQRMPWWKKLLVILATSAVAVAIYIWLPGLIIPLAIVGWLLVMLN